MTPHASVFGAIRTRGEIGAATRTGADVLEGFTYVVNVISREKGTNVKNIPVALPWSGLPMACSTRRYGSSSNS